jgi:ferritin
MLQVSPSPVAQWRASASLELAHDWIRAKRQLLNLHVQTLADFVLAKVLSSRIKNVPEFRQVIYADSGPVLPANRAG